MFVSFRKKYSTVTYNLLTSWLMTQCMCHIEREESFESAQVIGSEDAEMQNLKIQDWKMPKQYDVIKMRH